MIKCININHPDFKDLVENSGVDALNLSTKMGVWMEENNTEEWPTLEQLGITVTQPGVFNKQEVVDLMVADLSDETKDIMREEFLALPIDEFNEMAKSIGLNFLSPYWTSQKVYPRKVDSILDMSWINDKMSQIDENGIYTDRNGKKVRMDVSNNPFTWNLENKYGKKIVEFKDTKNYKTYTYKKAMDFANEIRDTFANLPIKVRVVGVQQNKYVIRIDYLNFDTELYYFQEGKNRRMIQNEFQEYKELADSSRAIAEEEIQEIQGILSNIKNGNITSLLNELELSIGFDEKLGVLFNTLKGNLNKLPNLKVVVSNDMTNPSLFGNFAILDGNNIVINENAFKYGQFANINELNYSIAHELIHAYTLGALKDKNSDFYRTMNRLYRASKAQTKYGKLQAYQSVEEFVAEVLVNPVLLSEVKQMKLSLWQRIKNLIRSILGIDQITMYDEVFNSTIDYIRKVNLPTTIDGKWAREMEKEFNLNKANPKHIDIWKALNKVSDRIEFVEASHEYFEKKADGTRGIQYSGVTSIMDAIRYGTNKDTMSEKAKESLSRSASIGSAIHYGAEANLYDISDQVAKDIGIELSPEARQQLFKILQKFKKKNVTILTEVLVADFAKGIASKIDMLVIDENNDIHLYDFKTKERGFTTWTVKYGYGNSLKKSARDKATLQLSVYKDMVEKITGLSVKTLNVVMIKPTVEGDTIVNVSLDTTQSTTNPGIDTVTYTRETKLVYNYMQSRSETPNFSDDTISGDTLSEFEARAERDRILLEMDMDFIDERGAILSDLIKTLQKKKAQLYKQGKRTDILRMEELLDKVIEEKNVEQRIIIIIKAFEKEASRIMKERNKFKKEGEAIPINVLTSWYYFVSGYEAIDRLQTVLTNEFGFDPKLAPKYSKTVDDVVKIKNHIKGLYELEGINQIVEFLAPHYNMIYVEFMDTQRRKYRKLKKLNKNMNMSEEEFVDSAVNENESNLKERTYNLLRTELKKASSDIHTLTRWIDNLLDSADPVTAAMVKAFVIKDETSRLDNLKIRDEFLSVAREFEKFNQKYSLKPKSLYEMYSFMLEKDDKGEPTGEIISRIKSAMYEELRNQKKLANEVYSTPEEIRDHMKAWKDMNAPLNSKAFATGYWDFVEGLLRNETIEGGISVKEYTALQDNEVGKKRRSISEMISDGLLNQAAGEAILNWMATHSWDYREPIDKWINPQWAELSRILKNPDDPRTKVYNLIDRYRRESDYKIPFTFRLNNRLPGVVKQSDEMIREGQSPLSVLRKSLANEFTFKVDDTHRQHNVIADNGEAKYFLPLHFTGRITKEVEEIDPNTGKPAVDDDGKIITNKVFDKDRQSFDVLGIYYKYATMANSYFHKNQILPEMELTKHFINTRKAGKIPIWQKILTASKINKGEEPPANKYDNQGEPIISKTQLADQVNDWFMQIVYGQQEEGNAKEGAIDNAKLVNFLNKYTSLNLIGLNFISGTANVILGETLQRIETFAGEYMKPKNFMKADKVYTTNFMGIVGDIGARKPDNLVSLLLQEFGVLDDYGKTDFDRFTKAGQLMTTDTLFFTSRAGEHYMQTRFLLGMLDTIDAYDDNGTRLGSMLDMYQVKDGKLSLKEGVNLSLSKWSDTDKFNFTYKTRGILSRLHGEYSDLGKVAIQRMAVGRMAYMFRKFVVPGFRRRWGKKQYIERLGQFVEGNYITTGKFIGSIGKTVFGKTEENKHLLFWQRLLDNLQHFQFALWSAEWESLTDHEKANVRRVLGEVVFLTTAIIVAGVASKNLSDDDDDEWYWSFISYQALRFRAELLFFSPKLDEAMSILRSPAASMSVIENVIELTSQMFDPLERYERGPFKGKYKWQKQLMDMTPVRRQFYRLQNVGEQAKWFQR